MEISFRNSSCALVNLLFTSLVCKVQPIKRKGEGKAAKSACLKAKYKNLSISIVKFAKTLRKNKYTKLEISVLKRLERTSRFTYRLVAKQDVDIRHNLHQGLFKELADEWC